MDSLAVMAPSIVHGLTLAGGAGVLHWEVVRRLGLGRDHIVRGGRALCSCGPELAGVGALLSFAFVLRLMGDTEVFTDPEEARIWEQIKVEWPVLLGADTLLGLQAMLRLAGILSARLRGASRTSGPTPTPLTGIPAALSACAGLARAAVTVRTRAYVLDGPLGGDLAVAFEIAVVPFLVTLGLSAFRERPLATSSLAAGAAWFASNNYLRLADDPPADRLFILAHTLDLLAACAFLVSAVGFFTRPRGAKEKRTGAPARFLHFLMAVQQALAAYYFLTAFEPSQNLVGAGRPYCLLILGGVAQLGAYLLASAFCFADAACVTEEDTEVRPSTEQQPAAQSEAPDDPTDEDAPAESAASIEV